MGLGCFTQYFIKFRVHKPKPTSRQVNICISNSRRAEFDFEFEQIQARVCSEKSSWVTKLQNLNLSQVRLNSTRHGPKTVISNPGLSAQQPRNISGKFFHHKIMFGANEIVKMKFWFFCFFDLFWLGLTELNLARLSHLVWVESEKDLPRLLWARLNQIGLPGRQKFCCRYINSMSMSSSFK